MTKHWIEPILLLLAGCGAEFVKPATTAEMAQHADVISYTKERYTSFRASMGQAQWWQGADAEVEVASFRIATNKTGWIDDQIAFERDIGQFCGSKGGRFETKFSRDVAQVIPALNSVAHGQEALQLLRDRAGNPPTFSCIREPGEYVFFGEAIFKEEGGDVVAIRIRLNQGLKGTQLLATEIPQVR